MYVYDILLGIILFKPAGNNKIHPSEVQISENFSLTH